MDDAPPRKPFDTRERGEIITWARTIDWDFFVSPTFTQPVSLVTAQAAVERWLRGFPHVYAFVGCQRSPAGLVHPHVMIGGTGRHPLVEQALTGSWRHGNLHCDRYHPSGGAIEYLVRQAEEFDIIGTPKPYHWRKR
jgi:hypothetical protein